MAPRSGRYALHLTTSISPPAVRLLSSSAVFGGFILPNTTIILVLILHHEKFVSFSLQAFLDCDRLYHRVSLYDIRSLCMDPIDSHIYSFDMVGETGLIHDVALETSPPNLEATSSPISEIPSEEPPTSSRRSTVLSNISAPSAWRIRRAGNMLALKPHERPASETSRNHSADSVLTKASSKVEGASRRALSSVIGSIKRRFGRGKKEVDSTSNGRDFDSDQISEKVPKEVDFSGQYPALQAKSDTRPPLLQALSEPLQAISGAHRRWNFHGRRPLSKNLVQRPNSEQYAYRPSIATSRDFGLAYPCLPKILADGVTMIKVSGKGEKQRKFRVDKEQELVLWESKKSGISKLFIFAFCNY